MEEQIKILIEKAISAAEKTGEFVLEQAPELIQQFIFYKRVENTFWTGFTIIAMVVIYQVTFKRLKPHIDSKLGEDSWSTAEALYIFPGVLFLTALIGFIDSLSHLIIVWAAPNIYLIEYFIK